MKPSTTLLAMAAFTLVVALPAAGAAAGAPAGTNTGPQGLAVVRDPQTGQLRPPTAAELQAMHRASGQTGRPAAQASGAAPAPVRRPDGVRAATVGERGMVYSVIRRGADGKLTQHCIEGEAAAAHAAHHGALPSQPRETNHE